MRQRDREGLAVRDDMVYSGFVRLARVPSPLAPSHVRGGRRFFFQERRLLMLPMVDLRLALGDTLAADTTTLAPAVNGNKVALIAAAFTPNEDLVVGDLTFATFTGSTPLVCGTGTQPVGIDPNTGQQVISIKEPAGGFRWECTADPSPAENIFGFALTDNAGATLFAVEAFDAPITISASGQFIEIPFARLTFVLQPMS